MTTEELPNVLDGMVFTLVSVSTSGSFWTASFSGPTAVWLGTFSQDMALRRWLVGSRRFELSCIIKGRHIQGIHKRMVRFQKLTNLFLTLHGHSVRRQQQQLSSFLMRYQLLMLTAGPVSKMASHQEKTFCVLRFEVSRSVITAHSLEKTHLQGASFLNRARNSSCTVITDLDTSKRITQKALSCCDAILETGPAVSMRSELLVALEKLGQLLLLTAYVVHV